MVAYNWLSRLAGAAALGLVIAVSGSAAYKLLDYKTRDGFDYNSYGK